MLFRYFFIIVGLGLSLLECAASKKSYEEDYQDNTISNSNEGNFAFEKHELKSGPPKPDQAAQMARYIVHHSDWVSIATISSMPKVKGFPFANVYSVSDGLLNNSSGIPFLYMTPLEMSGQDLAKDSRCSMTMTLAQGDYCKQQTLDPEDPRCARVILTGNIHKIENGTSEADFAQTALFTRHPIMNTWPKDHDWFFAKLEIVQICVLDYFGGPKFVKVEDYFNASPEENEVPVDVILV